MSAIVHQKFKTPTLNYPIQSRNSLQNCITSDERVDADDHEGANDDGPNDDNMARIGFYGMVAIVTRCRFAESCLDNIGRGQGENAGRVPRRKITIQQGSQQVLY